MAGVRHHAGFARAPRALDAAKAAFALDERLVVPDLDDDDSESIARISKVPWVSATSDSRQLT